MRHKRALNDKQIKYLIKNGHLPNLELAEKLSVSPQLIATYRYRAKKAGVEIPSSTRRASNTIADRMKKFANN